MRSLELKMIGSASKTTSVAALGLIDSSGILVPKHRRFGLHAYGITGLHTNALTRSRHAELKVCVLASCFLSSMANSILNGKENGATQEKRRLPDGFAAMNGEWIVNIF